MSSRSHLLARARALRDLPPPDDRRAIRERAGASQSACAETLGVSQQAFAFWETGATTPSGERAAAYVELLHDLEQAVSA